MIWLRSRVMGLAVLLPLGALLAACDDGPAEDAGEAIDETAEEASDTVEDAID